MNSLRDILGMGDIDRKYQFRIINTLETLILIRRKKYQRSLGHPFCGEKCRDLKVGISGILFLFLYFHQHCFLTQNPDIFYILIMDEKVLVLCEK